MQRSRRNPRRHSEHERKKKCLIRAKLRLCYYTPPPDEKGKVGECIIVLGEFYICTCNWGRFRDMCTGTPIKLIWIVVKVRLFAWKSLRNIYKDSRMSQIRGYRSSHFYYKIVDVRAFVEFDKY